MPRYRSTYRKKQFWRLALIALGISCFLSIGYVVAFSGALPPRSINVVSQNQTIVRAVTEKISRSSFILSVVALRRLPELFAEYPEIERIEANVFFSSQEILVAPTFRKPYVKICFGAKGQEIPEAGSTGSPRANSMNSRLRQGFGGQAPQERCVYSDNRGAVFARTSEQPRFVFSSQIDFREIRTVPPQILNAILFFSQQGPFRFSRGHILSNGDISVTDGSLELLIDPALPLEEQLEKVHIAAQYLAANKLSASRIDLRIPQKIFFR